jgi:hypothetical protein
MVCETCYEANEEIPVLVITGHPERSCFALWSQSSKMRGLFVLLGESRVSMPIVLAGN